jgi:hypothetical protein
MIPIPHAYAVMLAAWAEAHPVTHWARWWQMVDAEQALRAR